MAHLSFAWLYPWYWGDGGLLFHFILSEAYMPLVLSKILAYYVFLIESLESILFSWSPKHWESSVSSNVYVWQAEKADKYVSLPILSQKKKKTHAKIFDRFWKAIPRYRRLAEWENQFICPNESRCLMIARLTWRSIFYFNIKLSVYWSTKNRTNCTDWLPCFSRVRMLLNFPALDLIHLIPPTKYRWISIVHILTGADHIFSQGAWAIPWGII